MAEMLSVRNRVTFSRGFAIPLQEKRDGARYETADQTGDKNLARMHSRRKGKSGSKRPPHATIPEWITQSTEEIEAKIIDLAKQGLTSAMIGSILRDSHGVPSTKLVCKRKISEIRKEAEVYPEFPEDFRNLVRRALSLRRHLEAHPKDLHSRYGLEKLESKIRRLQKYYRKKGMIPKTFRYDPRAAASIIR